MSRTRPSRPGVPAWAGNTSRMATASCRWPGDPRVGGEHRSNRGAKGSGGGRSPRGRGTPRRAPIHCYRHREIPAWAGNTGIGRSRRQCASGDPRVGGEHRVFLFQFDPEIGRSPRGRGTRFRRAGIASVLREIPAWAGNTRCRIPRDCLRAGDPRVGGEHRLPDPLGPRLGGRSPRGRGTLPAYTAGMEMSREIPAWAGNTLGNASPPA